MAKFKLTHHKPFIFEGDNGKYEIPPLEELTYDQWNEVATTTMNANADPRVILAAYKTFFLKVCPELESEKIGDNQWLQFGNAYFESMGE